MGRVLHVLGSMNRGGAETLVYNLNRTLDRSRIQFDFALHTSAPGHYDSELRATGARLFSLPQPRQAGIRSYRRALARVIAEQGPFDAIHSHVRHFSGVVLQTAAASGIPIRLAHGHSFHEEYRPDLRRSAYLWWCKFLLNRHSTHLLGCGKTVCERLYGSRCWSDRRVSILRNAIELNSYIEPSHVGWLRSELGLGNSLLIGHVGSFREAKNHSFLLKAFAAVLDIEADAQLVLAGDGALERAVRSQAAALGVAGRVQFLGVRPDVPRILASLDGFLFPSLHEGLPTVLVEAQAAGVPCVISSAVTREVDLNLGLTKFLSLDAHPSEWARAAIATRETSKPALASRQAAVRAAGYDIKQATADLTELYLGTPNVIR